MELSPDIPDYIETIATLADEDIDLARAALSIALRDKPGLSVGRFENHLKVLEQDLLAFYKNFLKDEADSAALRVKALQSVFVQHEYHGDRETYDDLQNADLVRVIERRKGLPIVLSILCIHMGSALGWGIYGLALPGHFLCRLDFEGQRIIFDPFENCRVLQAQDLRGLIKRVHGDSAELSATYYEPESNRGILIRLQNNIKFRLIEAEDYENALKTAEIMRLIDPMEYRILLDVGVLYARTHRYLQAIKVLEEYIKLAPLGRDREEAVLLLHDLKSTLN